MREDTARLLELIGDREFPYQEFASDPAESDAWPLFAAVAEALARSKAIGGGARRLMNDPQAGGLKVEALAAGLVDRPQAQPAPAPAASFLGRYARAEPERPGVAHEDVGAFLQALAGPKP